MRTEKDNKIVKCPNCGADHTEIRFSCMAVFEINEDGSTTTKYEIPDGPSFYYCRSCQYEFGDAEI